ncbi:MAG: hypothetical protein QG559_1368 [Campylobacterota bacterium]|nr:hypothetical protein [Campylobacterota bacterium]
MNINYFFLFVSVVLMMILFFFQPKEVTKNKFGDIALFNISSFTMYEFDSNGLITLMNGKEATRYKNRYTVSDIDYTDNSKEYVANMKAKNAIYKNEIVHLDGDIIYSREDGLIFETQKATYDKKKSIARVNGEYVVYMEKNRAIGKGLEYNNSSKKLKTKDVFITYQLNEGKK